MVDGDGHNTDLIIRYTIRSIKNFMSVLSCGKCELCFEKWHSKQSDRSSGTLCLDTPEKVFKHTNDAVCMHNVSRYPIHV